MTRRFVVVAAVAAMGVLATGIGDAVARGKSVVGSGKSKTETRTVSGVERVDVSGVGTLFVEMGKSEGLTVEADDNLLPLIQTTMRGGTLVIAAKPGTDMEPKAAIRYRLRVSRLEALTLAGATEADVKSLPAVGTLRVTAAGASGASFERIAADDLTVKVAGASKVRIAAGTVKTQTVSVAGASRYEAIALSSDAATVEAVGASEATLSAKKSLSVKAVGASRVRYGGNPAVVRSDAVGASSVAKAR